LIQYELPALGNVALNPTDWKHVTYLRGASPFSIVGCDYAGTVVSIGAEVTKPFKVGDRVYGCAHGVNENEACDSVFAEYAMVQGDVAMHVPTTLGMEDLSTAPLGSITV
jgi:NADPH:quinone reductase-like Zn-dependent oxidoreductase